MTGYRDPPKDTRFKKGQSGNPNGRPKRSGALSHASKVTLEAARRKVTIREGGVARDLDAVDAIQLAQQKSALGGSALAQKHFLDRYEKAEAARREEIAAENERWTAIVEELRFLRAEAESRGATSIMPFPHPDDIVIDPENGVSFIGPIDEVEDARLQRTLRMRDLLFAQDLFDHRYWKGTTDDPDDRPGSAALFALALDRGVPARHRLSNLQIVSMTLPYARMTRRELTKFLFRSWRALGAMPCRGYTFPSISTGKQYLINSYRALAEARGHES